MRTTILSTVSHDAPLHHTALPEGPVYVGTRSPWQEGHQHHMQAPTRLGDSSCIGCGASAWSPAWVRPNVYGDDASTGYWLAETERIYQSMLDSDAVSLLERELGAVEITAVVAVLEPSEPARRAGIPVSKMPPIMFVRGQLGG